MSDSWEQSERISGRQHKTPSLPSPKHQHTSRHFYCHSWTKFLIHWTISRNENATPSPTLRQPNNFQVYPDLIMLTALSLPGEYIETGSSCPKDLTFHSLYKPDKFSNVNSLSNDFHNVTMAEVPGVCQDFKKVGGGTIPKH